MPFWWKTKVFIEVFNIKNWEELSKLYLKIDVFLIPDVFRNFIEVSFEDFDIFPPFCVSLLGYNWQCHMRKTDNKLWTLQGKDMILSLENNIRGGIISVKIDRYIKLDEIKNILDVDDNNLYGHSMSQPLPKDEIIFNRNVNLEDILNTLDD